MGRPRKHAHLPALPSEAAFEERPDYVALARLVGFSGTADALKPLGGALDGVYMHGGSFKIAPRDLANWQLRKFAAACEEFWRLARVHRNVNCVQIAGALTHVLKSHLKDPADPRGLFEAGHYFGRLKAEMHSKDRERGRSTWRRTKLNGSKYSVTLTKTQLRKADQFIRTGSGKRGERWQAAADDLGVSCSTLRRRLEEEGLL